MQACRAWSLWLKAGHSVNAVRPLTGIADPTTTRKNPSVLTRHRGVDLARRWCSSSSDKRQGRASTDASAILVRSTHFASGLASTAA